jgi:hypothetical protein
MNFREVGSESMDCIALAHDRGKRRAVVNAVMKFRAT